MPKFSIIIPVYNSRETIFECLDSIAGQTLKDFEVCLVDGGSNDGTLDILEQFCGRRANFNFISEPDRGVYDAMNKGLSLTKGNWLYFLGSDDKFNDEKVLQALWMTLKENSECDIIYGNVCINGNNEWRFHGELYAGKFNLEKLLQMNISQQAVFYRRRLFARMGLFNINYRVSADYDFMLRCFAAGISIVFTDNVIAQFAVGGISSTTWDEKFEQEKGMLIIHYFSKILYKKEFAGYRLYIKRLAFELHNGSSFFERLYFAVCYLLQKSRSLINRQ